MATKPKPAAKKAAKPAAKVAVKKSDIKAVKKTTGELRNAATSIEAKHGDKKNASSLRKTAATLEKAVTVEVRTDGVKLKGAPKKAVTIEVGTKSVRVVKASAAKPKVAAKKPVVKKIDKLTKVQDVPMTSAQRSLANIASVALMQRHQGVKTAAVAAAPAPVEAPAPKFERPAVHHYEEDNLSFRDKLRLAHQHRPVESRGDRLERLRRTQS